MSGKPERPPAQTKTPGTEAAPATGRASEQGAAAGLLALLNIEAEARAAGSLSELQFLIASETRKVTRARQVFVYRSKSRDRMAIEVISGLPAVDSASPLVVTFETIVEGLAKDQGLDKSKEFEFSAYCRKGDEFLASYPFGSLLWLPLLSRAGVPFGGMLLTRETPWTEADIVVAKRLSQTFAHAIRELTGVQGFNWKALFGRTTALAFTLAALIAMVVPVSLTALAPFEIGPKNGFVVAAPIEGIIEEIPVAPNTTVAEGDLLVRFSGTVLKNRLEIADREVLVADARLKKATQTAFEDPRGRHELGVLMSELSLKTAERDLARDILERSQIKAPRSGIAVFGDKKQLMGRPVAIGERIMEIADPKHVEAVIEVPLGDAIVLKRGARVKLFLDSDPLHPRDAIINAADYLARPRPGNQVAFRVIAELADGGKPPRLGVRGTAQIYGKRVPLGFFLFRRPLTVLRQWTGL